LRSPTPFLNLPTLTSLRFFAAAMIFAFHLREFAPTPLLYALAPAMYHGVSFFFVLSGFVLTYAYADRDISWSRFFLARYARLAPAHLAALALLIAVLPPLYACGQRLEPGAAALALALKAAMLDAWFPVRGVQQSWNNVSWSLSIEMAFYAAFPALLAAMTRRPALTLGAVAALSAAVPLAAAAAGVPVFAPGRNAISLFNLASCWPPARLAEFALGMATCLAWRRFPRIGYAWATAAEAAAVAGAGLWLFLVVPSLVGAARGVPFVILRAAGSAPVFAALIAALAAGQGAIGRLLSWRPFVALGEASFAFYLVHMIVMRALRYWLGDSPGALDALALSLPLAFLLHEAVEIPMRRRILARRAPDLRERTASA